MGSVCFFPSPFNVPVTVNRRRSSEETKAEFQTSFCLSPGEKDWGNIWLSSNTQSHDGIDDVVVVLLERLDRLFPRHVRLVHHEFDILRLQTRVVDLLVVIFLLLGFLVLGRFTLARAFVGVVVTRVVSRRSRLGGGKLLGGDGLGLGV